MRGLIMILFCLGICCSSSGQVRKGSLSVYTEPLKYFKRGLATIGFDYSFNENWSAEGSVSLPLIIRKGIDCEETEHKSDLSKHNITGAEDMSASRSEYRMGICFWMKKHTDGTFLRVSCACRTGHGADLILGAGYALPVWRGIGVCIGYEVGVMSVARSDVHESKDINIRLLYRF